MTSISVTNFRKNMFDYVGNVIRFNDPVHITTREGSAVLISETDYNSMIASIFQKDQHPAQARLYGGERDENSENSSLMDAL